MNGAPRLHYLDWLRVAAIGGVFVFHTLRAFDPSDWHVKNAETSPMLDAVMFLFSSFGLAVLFLLAGAGARFALRRRPAGTFVRERVTRLLVPFVAGTLLLGPLQAYIEATHKGTYAGPLAGFPGWWADGVVAALGRAFSPTVFGIGYHLWFLGFLFAISIVALPVCVALMSARGRDAVAFLAERSGRPGASLAFAVPIAVLLGISAPFGTATHDWFEFGWYLGYFLVGFVVFSDERLVAALRRDLGVAVAVALAAIATLSLVDVGAWTSRFAERGIDWTYPLMGLLFASEGWALTVVVLNVGLRAARLGRPVGERIGDMVLPLYVIHQPVILVVAFFVVQWPIGILPKWLVVFAVSLPVTLALVELALRAPVVRVLLGARVRAAATAAPLRVPA